MTTSESEKPYRLTFEPRPSYLYVYVEGEEDSYEISAMYWREIADKCKASRFTKVLIVEDIIANGTIADAYQLSSDLPHMGYLGIKVAFVDKYLDQQELNLFGELTAVNRGINAKVFNDINEAEKWLLTG